MDFKPGDVVILKSGGPTMTVSSVNGNEIGCIWFEKMKIYSKPFPAVVLTKYEINI